MTQEPDQTAGLDFTPSTKIEIERKYLLSAVPDLSLLTPDCTCRSYEIRQGYFDPQSAAGHVTLYADLLACDTSDLQPDGRSGIITDLPATRWIRLRQVIEASRPLRHIMTYKTGHGASRVEREQSITPEQFETLWPCTVGKRLNKARSRIQSESDRKEGIIWVVDEFLDRTLILLEAELISVDQHVSFSPWLAPLVVREVTDDPAFSNVRLAR